MDITQNIFASPMALVDGNVSPYAPTGRFYNDCAGQGSILTYNGYMALISPNCVHDVSGYGPTPNLNGIKVSFLSETKMKFEFNGVNGLVCDKQNLPPAIPSNLSLTTSALAITLAWTDNSSDETGFKILRKDTLTGPYNVITTTAANIVTYSDTVPAAGTYWYRVESTNANGDSLGSNEVSVTVP